MPTNIIFCNKSNYPCWMQLWLWQSQLIPCNITKIQFIHIFFFLLFFLGGGGVGVGGDVIYCFLLKQKLLFSSLNGRKKCFIYILQNRSYHKYHLCKSCYISSIHEGQLITMQLNGEYSNCCANSNWLWSCKYEVWLYICTFAGWSYQHAHGACMFSSTMQKTKCSSTSHINIPLHHT